MEDKESPSNGRALAAKQSLREKESSSTAHQRAQTANADEAGFTTFTMPLEKPKTTLFDGSTPDEGLFHQASPGAVGQPLPPLPSVLPPGPKHYFPGALLNRTLLPTRLLTTYNR